MGEGQGSFQSPSLGRWPESYAGSTPSSALRVGVIPGGPAGQMQGLCACAKDSEAGAGE